MYIDSSTVHGKKKSYTRHLLRSSFRENGKVKHKTVANLSSCSPQEIQAMKLALKYKDELAFLRNIQDTQISLGKSIGAVWLVKAMAEKLGILEALGHSPQARCALFQVMARLIIQGSRLSAIRFGQRQAACEILGIQNLNEDDLYQNLNWVSQHQSRIEQSLFKFRFGDTKPSLFLYDVTSTYLEGQCNEMANWGYNRDKKKGKKHIVVGLLTNDDGIPLAVRVFEGNTLDPKTLSEQVQILKRDFNIDDVTLVGDRGMIKAPQIEALPNGFKYITAITKPQIMKMLTEGVFQYELFAEDVTEVICEGIRYVLRRNPWRAKEMGANRKSKFEALERTVQQRNAYLKVHPRAKAEKALEVARAKAEKMKISFWVQVSIQGQQLELEKDQEALNEVSLLDGCYVIKSDVPQEMASPQQLHARYCDLEKVERAFRTMKTFHLELRPVFVRTKENTKGHVFLVMLALIIQRELEQLWGKLDITVEEGIQELSSIHYQCVRMGDTQLQMVPEPNQLGKELLKAAQIQLPTALPQVEANVHTKKKLTSERN